MCGQDGVVGIAVRYELYGPVIESSWGRDIPHTSRAAMGHVQPATQLAMVQLPRVKRSGRGVHRPLSSSAGVKGRVGLYLYFLSGLHGLF
jgi:hypothetical protein